MRTRRPRPTPATRSAFAGFRFPPDVIVVAVRWYLRFGLPYRDVEELLAERGVKVAGRWRYVYRAIDQFGQVIDVFVSARRDTMAANPMVLEELLPVAWHRTKQYANNRVEADHGRLKARLRPMRGSSRTPAPG
jgi:transposase, IS6 family